MTVGPGHDIAGGGQALVGQEGAWAMYTPVNLHQIDQLALRVSSATASTVELRRGAPDGELLATAEVSATGARDYRDVVVDVTDPGTTFDLYVVFPGPGARRLNFIEAIGKGSSPETRPRVTVTAPEEGVVLEPGSVIEVTAEATDAENTVTEVEFFVDGESIGTDTEAPYTTTWEPDGEKVYRLTAVATNDLGLTTTSRVVGAQVGELFGNLVQFSNAGGEFEKVDDGVFAITGAGNNAWQSVDQYSTLYQPGGADDDSWEAVVRVNSQTHAHQSAKSGLIVRNDATLPGQSPGYALLGIRPNNGVEFLRDTDGNGQLDASTAAGSTSYPIWLKLKRDGDQLTAFRSPNGSTWTQVGVPAVLPGVVSPQDVGMVTVAHSGTPGTAEFQGFAVDSDPDTEEPEEPLQPLRCPGPLSDEFGGDELASKWSVRQAPATPITVADGALQLPVTAGDINEGSTGPISFVGQPTPDGEWEASARITLDHVSHWQWAGLLVHQSDDEYNKLAFVRHENGNRFLEFQTETGGTRTNHGAFTVPAGFPSTAYLKLVSNGTTLTAHYSTDGESWTQMAGTAPLKANAEIGLAGAGDLGATPVVAEVDWFRVDPDREAPEVSANDEFDGSELDGCRWARTVRYDSNHVEVADGELKVTTQLGDINNDNPDSPRNLILQDAPGGDWVATTRLKATMTHRWQYAGLLVYGDDDNYVKADIVADNQFGSPTNIKAELVSEVNGGFGAGGNRVVEIPETSESGWWYLRVTRTGSSYAAEVSDGGINWTPIGAPVTHEGDLSAVGLVAVGPEQVEPVTIAFDYFHLDADEGEDATAPTTELTLDPAEADGDNGWYTSAPTFTLSADDGDGSGVATTEYRLGDGDWTAYDEPVVLEDGDHAVSYRSTDQAGNVEEAGSTRVPVDTVAPVTTAEVVDEEAQAVVTLTAVDATAGVALTEVAVGDGDRTAYDEPRVVSEPGTHLVS
ncbi:DUF1349 domain-containing protein, partial [Nocardioides sp.]|uniref:DUF1349 domain-containing protein n=1 Tax=Nocardioides sp. TaxID=35761 RepID=UPI002736F975